MHCLAHNQRVLWVVAFLIVTVGIMSPQLSSLPPSHPKRTATLNDLIEHIELREGAETIGGASMEDAVSALRELADFPVALEMLEFKRPEDFVTLAEALEKLHQMQATEALGSRDKGRWNAYEEMAQTHKPSTIPVARQRAFTLVEDRITVRDLLDRLMALDDEYTWKNYGGERAPVIVIQPQARTALGWPVPSISDPRLVAYAELIRRLQ
jgi:hypothetical protein